ncbi:MAG: hypothetical protein WEB30_10510 [Cyclobacteriaceae bacterium]
MTVARKRTHGTLVVLMSICLSAHVHPLFSQAFTRYNYASQAGGGSLNFQIAPFDEETAGSPYYSEEWKKGAVYNRDNSYTELDQLKYNLHLGELVFVYNGTQYIIPRKEQIVRFTLGEEEFTGAFDGARYSFYKMLEPGEAMVILKKFHCSITKGEPSKGYIPATKDQYVVRESIYVLKPGQDALELNPKKGMKLLSYVHDKRGEMEEYIKSNKLKMKSLEDLTAAVRHYNSISSKNAGTVK